MRNTMKMTGTAGLTAAVLMATVAAGAAPPEARAAIEEANARFMALLAKGDAAGVAAMYAADAQMFPPGSDIVSGAAGIRNAWQGVIDAGVKSAKFTTVDVTASGDLASETGRYEVAGVDGAVLDAGKYVVVWKRAGGRWMILRDIWNTNRPMLPPAK